VTLRGVNDGECFQDGVSVAADGTVADAVASSFSWFLFARNVNGTAFEHSGARLSAAHIGTGLTDTDASNLSTRVNAAMTAIGANVY
jgi:hypothetical protein